MKKEKSRTSYLLCLWPVWAFHGSSKLSSQNLLEENNSHHNVSPADKPLLPYTTIYVIVQFHLRYVRLCGTICM